MKKDKCPGLQPWRNGAYAASSGEKREPPNFLPGHTKEYKRQWLEGYDMELKRAEIEGHPTTSGGIASNGH